MKRLVQISIAFIIIALLRIKNKQASANDLPGMLGYDIERENHGKINYAIIMNLATFEVQNNIWRICSQ